MKLYKKQIKALAEEIACQGFRSSVTDLTDWIDVTDTDEEIENKLKQKWTQEEMEKVTGDPMRILRFSYRFVEYTGIVLDEFINDAKGI